MESYKIESFSCDTVNADIQKLFANIHEFINISSISKIADFMEKAGLLQINFNGGALIKTDSLKSEFVIDDYDIFIVDEINEEIFLASKKKIIRFRF